MILGELIGLIALPVMWVLFGIGTFGMMHELKEGHERLLLDIVYCMCFVFGSVIGTFLLWWLLDVSGAWVNFCSFMSNLWNIEL